MLKKVQGRGFKYGNYVLIVLTFCNLLNLWHRYLPFTLSAVSTPQCYEECVSVPFIPLCESCPLDEIETQCLLCQSCRYEEDSWKVNMQDGACISNSQYGILAGFGFTVMFSVCGLLAGRLSDTLSKRLLHSFAITTWSFATILQGTCASFPCMLLSRIILGIGEAFNAPCAYILIAQYFSDEQRATANGVYASGTYLGAGLSSLSIIMAEIFGWRDTCAVAGASGICIAVLYFLTIKEIKKPRKLITEDFPSIGVTVNTVLSSWKGLLLILASSFRMISTYAKASYMPSYFMRAFPHKINTFSVMNAVVIAVGGIISSVLGGRLSDKWSKTNLGALALIPAAGAVLSLLPLSVALFTSNFFVAIAAMLTEHILAECWLGPGMAILQMEIPQHMHGVGVSILLFINTIIGSLGPHILSMVDPGTSLVRVAIFVTVFCSHIIAGLVFWYLSIEINNTEKCRKALHRVEDAIVLEQLNPTKETFVDSCEGYGATSCTKFENPSATANQSSNSIKKSTSWVNL